MQKMALENFQLASTEFLDSVHIGAMVYAYALCLAPPFFLIFIFWSKMKFFRAALYLAALLLLYLGSLGTHAAVAACRMWQAALQRGAHPSTRSIHACPGCDVLAGSRGWLRCG